MSGVSEVTNESTKPFIEGDTIVNATRGKSAILSCVVHNVKNYKVSFFKLIQINLNPF